MPESAFVTGQTVLAIGGDAGLRDSLVRAAAELPLERIAIEQVAAPPSQNGQASYRAIFLDLGQATDAVAGAQQVASLSVHGPVIAITDGTDAGFESRLEDAGAIEVLRRDEVTPRALRRCLRHTFARGDAQRRLSTMRLLDPVTSLASQALFWEFLELAVHRARRKRDFFSVLLIDLGGLPATPQEAHDQAMQILAGRVGGVLRSSDTIGRIDHQRLVILADSMPRIEDIQIVAGRLIEELGQPIPWGDGQVNANAEIGIALFPTSAETPEALMGRATEALLAAQARGRNEFVFA